MRKNTHKWGSRRQIFFSHLTQGIWIQRVLNTIHNVFKSNSENNINLLWLVYVALLINYTVCRIYCILSMLHTFSLCAEYLGNLQSFSICSIQYNRTRCNEMCLTFASSINEITDYIFITTGMCVDPILAWAVTWRGAERKNIKYLL